MSLARGDGNSKRCNMLWVPLYGVIPYDSRMTAAQKVYYEENAIVTDCHSYLTGTQYSDFLLSLEKYITNHWSSDTLLIGGKSHSLMLNSDNNIHPIRSAEKIATANQNKRQLEEYETYEDQITRRAIEIGAYAAPKPESASKESEIKNSAQTKESTQSKAKIISTGDSFDRELIRHKSLIIQVLSLRPNSCILPNSYLFKQAFPLLPSRAICSGDNAGIESTGSDVNSSPQEKTHANNLAKMQRSKSEVKTSTNYAEVTKRRAHSVDTVSTISSQKRETTSLSEYDQNYPELSLNLLALKDNAVIKSTGSDAVTSPSQEIIPADNIPKTQGSKSEGVADKSYVEATSNSKKQFVQDRANYVESQTVSKAPNSLDKQTKASAPFKLFLSNLLL